MTSANTPQKKIEYRTRRSFSCRMKMAEKTTPRTAPRQLTAPTGKKEDPLYSRFPKQGPAEKEGPYVGHTTVGAHWHRGAVRLRTRGSGPRRTKRASSLAGSLRGGTSAPKHHGARTSSRRSCKGKELDSDEQRADPALDEMRLNQRLDVPAQKLAADLILDDGVELDGCKLRAQQALDELRLD
ncbi:hypothetical protein PF008_g30862 [Phytophthora fragariae]|uniref:Uncharacterized protein n=1 Tax=Phytophthora fragariae TaxID=53985 RepID=A0A6G0Q4E9_9STRA|nr:hypothetical protein PF008_g30862 [Phytophthora fragariae]